MQKFAITLVLSLTPALFGQNGLIVTVAGSGITGTSGVGGPAVNAAISGGSICVDSADNFYIADRGNNRVVKVDAPTGILTLVAGNGIASSAGDLGPATQASLNAPFGIAMDTAGNLFISEFMGNRVRRVDAATGIITTMAGNGVAGWAGDGGPAVNGSLHYPMGLAFDLAGNLYIADAANYRIRRVDAATAILTTIAGTGVNGHSPDGTPAASANLALPMAVSFDRQGDLLITESYGYAVRRVSGATGLLSTVAGNGGADFNGDGEPATSAALGMFMSNVATDAAGNLYFADGTGRVRRIDAASGIIATVAGSGAGAHGQTSAGAGGGGGGTTSCPSGLGDNGPATIATLDGAMGVAFTSNGRLLISDGIDCRVRGVQLPSPLLYTNTSLSLAGQTLTATVTPIGGSATPTGTVQFMEYLSYGPPLPLASATLSGGTATLDANSLSAGSHQVMAIYMGDGAYNGSGSAALAATGGGRAMPSMGANVPYPAVVSTPVTLNITVVGSRGQPTGTVQISEGGTMLMLVSLINGGNSQYAYSSNTAGDHQITLQYSGDANYTPLTWTFTITLLVPSTVTLTADANPALAGASVTFTATVSPSAATGGVAFFDGGSWLGTPSLTDGRASVTVSTLSAGTHSITAIYSGDLKVAAPGTSNVWTETINSITPTTLTLATSGSPSIWGQGVALNASIAPAAATGTVVFYDGATQLGSAALSAGSAHLTTTQLAVGSHTLTAVYNANAGYGASTSPAVVQVVNKATPVVTLASSANPVVNPAPVTFTATMTPASDGVVIQIMDGQTLLGSGSAPTGVFSLGLASLTPGVHTITAVSLADNNLNQATSAALSQTVQAPTTITLSSLSGTTVFGQPVTFTAAVAPAASTGTVQFSDGSTAVGSAPIVNGLASLTLPALSAGSHSMQAAYNGDGIYLASASGVWVQTVNKASTSIVLVSSLNPAVIGQSVVFTATLLPAATTGSVQFLDGAAVLATVPVSGASASFASTTLSAGSHSITAVYGGDANCNAVASAVVTQTVTKAPSTTAVSASSGTIVFGQNVDLTASVSPASATGTVQFLDGATVLATQPVSGGSVPVVTASNLAAGTHAITAVYSGDSAYAGSTSAATTVTVAKAATTVAIGSSANPSLSGTAVTFNAVVSPAAATGSVQFLDGAASLGTVALSGGMASLSTAALAPGNHSITAAYSGDGNYSTSTSAALPQVVKGTTTTTVTSNPASPIYGQAVQLTATVAPSAATGSVQFFDGAASLGSASLSLGSAVLTVSNLAVATHAITASYSGNDSNQPSTSAALVLTVSKANSAVALASAPNPSTFGGAVTLTATVSPTSATGSVQFLDGAASLGTVNVAGGTASLTVSALTAGTHSISASYGGDTTYAPSASAALAQSVSKANSAVALASAPNPSTFGGAVTLTATVSPTSATGSVKFLDGAASLGTVNVAGGTASLTVSALTAGTHSISAAYSGDGNYLAANSAPRSQTVNKAGSVATISSSVNPGTAGQPVTFIASVSPGSATGSVRFLDGAAVLGTASLSTGSASFTTSSLSAGSHSISASYGGDSNYNGSSSAVLTEVVKTATATSLSSNGTPSTYGNSVQFTASISPNTATGTVQFLDGATVMATVAVSSGKAAFTTSSLSAGSHSIVAIYSGDSTRFPSTSAVWTQTVNKAGAGVSLRSSLNPSTFGQSVTFTATVSPGAATGTVQFLDGSTILGAVAVGAGSSSLTVSSLIVGSHRITAAYSGETNYNSAVSGILTQNVNKANTSTTLASSLNPSRHGQSVSLTATVSPAGGTGTVQFLDGTHSLGVVSVTGGRAVLTTNSLSTGSHSITAVYSGDGSFNGSTSGTLKQVVN
jgi:hypothetical protein